jgi:hypothetical protein
MPDATGTIRAVAGYRDDPRGTRDGAGSKMPLVRYFLFVGGALIALLLFLDAYFPSQVVNSATATGGTVADVGRPMLRIRSSQKLPERIVIDTSIPTIVPPPAPTVVAEAPATAPVLDALAQVAPSDLKKSDPKKSEPKPPPKRKVAKRQVHQPVVAYAQAPRLAYAQAPRLDFDLFGRSSW